MSNRITEANLKGICDVLNRITNSPQDTYKRNSDGTYTAQIGNYHLSFAYGGVSLHRICTDGGGVEDVFRCGHTTKRDLYNRMCAYVDGLRQTAEVIHE